jgi:hypothetical protein
MPAYIVFIVQSMRNPQRGSRQRVMIIVSVSLGSRVRHKDYVIQIQIVFSFLLIWSLASRRVADQGYTTSHILTLNIQRVITSVMKGLRLLDH